jgi:hypothetical protein
MPLYTLVTQDGTLSSDAKAKLAMELTTLHSEYAGVPKNWVHVVFHGSTRRPDCHRHSGSTRQSGDGDGAGHAGRRE